MSETANNPEELELLASALRRHPETRMVHPSTGRRWSIVGAKTPAGETVKLQVRRIGSRVCTSQRFISDFVNALNGAQEDKRPTPRSPAVRNRASSKAKQKLADRLAVA